MKLLEKLKNDRQDLISKLCDNIDSLERIALEQQAVNELAAKQIVDLKIKVKEQKAEIEELIYKLECLLCHATDGRLSKHTYPLKVMETEVTDAMNGNYNQGYYDGIKEFTERLKEKADSGFWQERSYVDVEDIDNLVKEMVGD